MTEKEFSLRLARLRSEKGVSARDMSLSMGQNPGYINNIETGKALPSMGNFFYICNYLDITPMDFFDYHTVRPGEMEQVCRELNKLSDLQFGIIKKLSVNWQD